MLRPLLRSGSILAMALMLALSVGACGKKSSPKAPSEDSKFPQQYPSE